MYSRALIMENKWRASRYGLDGMLIDFGRETGAPRPRADSANISTSWTTCSTSSSSRKEVEYVQTILDRGTGADRQLQVFEQTNDLQEGRRVHGARRRTQGPGTSTSAYDGKAIVIRKLSTPSCSPGARNAIRVCLNVQPHERVTRDHRSRLRGDRGQPGARDRRGRRAVYGVRARRRRAAAARPRLPGVIAADMEQSDVSIFAVHVQPNELARAWR